MSQHAIAAQDEPPQLQTGQVWRPLFDVIPGISKIRIVCRYPFATAQDGPMWVIEHINTVQRIDRISENTLRTLWTLESDAPTL